MIMNAKVKRISILAVLALALISVLAILPAGVFAKANADEQTEEERVWTLEDTQAVAAFIQNNLETFVQKYNQSREDESEYLHASSVERTKIVNLIEDENYGAYIDFDGDNGYVVVTGDYTIYDLQTEGDLDYLDNAANIYYGYGKFHWLDQNGTLQLFAEAESAPTPTEQPVYDGNAGKDGDGVIINLSEYVNANYSKYTYEGNKFGGTKVAFNYAIQEDLSYYLWNACDANGGIINYAPQYEGNCSLTAMYNIFKSWGQYGKLNVPYATTLDLSKSIVNDPLYATYGNKIISYSSNGTTEYRYWQIATGNLRAIPAVYDKIRSYTISGSYIPPKDFYKPDKGFNREYVPTIMELTADYYDSGAGVFMYYTYSEGNALMSIKNGKAAYLSLTNDPVYINHGVAIIDYHYYTYTSGWWIFKTTDEVFILEIADGRYSQPTYYDIQKNPNTLKSYYSWNKE